MPEQHKSKAMRLKYVISLLPTSERTNFISLLNFYICFGIYKIKMYVNVNRVNVRLRIIKKIVTKNSRKHCLF